MNIVYEEANSVLLTIVIAPTSINNYVIGSKAVNIKKIRQDFKKVHTEFADQENKIKIQGSTKKVKKPQAELEKAVKELLRNTLSKK